MLKSFAAGPPTWGAAPRPYWGPAVPRPRLFRIGLLALLSPLQIVGRRGSGSLPSTIAPSPTITGKFTMTSVVGWLVGCSGFNGPLKQYFSLYRAASQREGERGKKR